ncbi:mannose-1-phosphate guanylyltransferase/mannose-6-phosphate isomerase [Roseovarius sp.]|uniref:mannose-1-phosphate guanylyltransferase/mannose-6-phosphate isomerase n=1 Tax=Roseovarius sp. TaxID=1486281 RepID=UPI0026285A7F|nr:mannose-1-phosphate guanylyltransferase/mannose-6-phosphate isomerase [Roseovarius sp.]
MTQITPVILCGGSGTRLWPLSRKSFPKQFAQLLGPESLFQASAARVHGAFDDLEFAPPVILTNSDFRFIVTEQLFEVGIDPGAILIEPASRNTAPAVLAAAMHAVATNPEAILLIAPSDHVIPDAAAFHAAVSRGLEAVRGGALVTFGIEPDRAETGYGYLELSQKPDGSGRAIPLKTFVEKPDAKTAAHMVEAGTYFWNAGIFLFAAKDIIAAFEKFAADLVAPVRAALDDAIPDLGFLRLEPEAWCGVRNISIDYAVMEKAETLSVVPFTASWSDLGSWEAVQQQGKGDANGVVLSGAAQAIDCSNSLLRSESSNLELIGLGLDGIMAVAMPDAVLVADLSRSQDVKLVVETLKAKDIKQAEAFSMDHRPWGHFETLVIGERFQVKRIYVKPGAKLSLQSHHHRSEHWIVVAGTAKVTIDATERLMTENESVYIPLGARHRLENPGKVPMILIEVQTGTYLGEDDIIRYEDDYARGQGAKG